MLSFPCDSVRSILCLGAHADDLEIGCGGTLMQLLAERPREIDVHWVVLSGDTARSAEAARGGELFLANARRRKITVKGFRDTCFPFIGGEIKDFFATLQKDESPDLIFTHRREDLHQDHRLVAELTWCAFRNHVIFEYEIPKYEGDLGHPNLFVPLPEAICRRKVESLVEVFATQRSKPWFTPDTFWSLLRLRGVECNSPTRFAEAFTCRKLVLSAC
ncbi:MAG TPA: PIG-L deacetylase family protein [Pirellulales bacterium]